jgi:hypothetical protein
MSIPKRYIAAATNMPNPDHLSTYTAIKNSSPHLGFCVAK